MSLFTILTPSVILTCTGLQVVLAAVRKDGGALHYASPAMQVN